MIPSPPHCIFSSSHMINLLRPVTVLLVFSCYVLSFSSFVYAYFKFSLKAIGIALWSQYFNKLLITIGLVAVIYPHISEFVLLIGNTCLVGNSLALDFVYCLLSCERSF